MAEPGGPASPLEHDADVAPKRRRSRRKPRPPLSGSALLATVVFGAHLVVAPLLLGGIRPWAMLVIAASGLLSLAVSAHAARPIFASGTPFVIWMAMGLLGWTCLQATPLPCKLVESIAPDSAAQIAATYSALRRAPTGWCALSRDPGNTRQEIIKGIAIVSSLLAAYLLAALRLRRAIFWCVAGSTLVMSVIALVHGILRLDLLFGIYQPQLVTRRLLLAPLLNANNLGAFAALGAPLWLGLTHRAQAPELRWLGRLAMAITTATALLALSRGAAAQVLAGLIVMFWLASRTSKRERQWVAGRDASRGRLGLIVSAAVALGFAVYVGGESIAAEFSFGDLSKLNLIGRSLAFAAEHPFVGVGRGAFSAAFVGLEGRSVRFVHAENFIAQWASEWGIPLTLAWLAAVCFALYRALPGTRSLASLGAATALLFLTAQNLVDLGFEILGIAVTAAALLGALIAPEVAAIAQRRLAKRLASAVSLQLVAGVVAVALLGPSLPGHAVPELGARLRQSLRANDRATFAATLERAVTLHPSEPLFAVLAATEALAHDDRGVGRWLSRAMQLAPKWSAPHVLAFDWLWSRGRRDQALIELRLAGERVDGLHTMSEQICVLARLSGQYVLQAAPAGPNREAFLQTATACVEDQHPAAAAVDEAMMREFPNNTRGFERTADRLAKAGEVDQAIALLDGVIGRLQRSDAARTMRAHILVRAARYEEGIARISEDLPRVELGYKPALLRLLGYAHAARGEVDGVRQAVEQHRRASGDSAPKIAQSFAVEGELEQMLGHSATALGAYQEAYRINQDTAYLVQVASLARQLGDRPQEAWALLQLCQHEPTNASFCALRDRLVNSSTASEPPR